MKYKINTIIVLVFFSLVFFGLAFNHLTNKNSAPPTVTSIVSDSPELQTIMRMLLSDMDSI